GNVIGSNIANILLILGLCALVAPLRVSRQLIRLDVPPMIGAGLLTYALAYDGRISRLDGGVLLVALIGYTTFLVLASRRERRPLAADEFVSEFHPEPGARPAAWLKHLLLVGFGAGLLVAGAHL